MNFSPYIKLYRKNNLWCFDYPSMGIIEEPFVEGIDDIIDAVAARNLGVRKNHIPSELILRWSTDENDPAPNKLLHLHSEERFGQQWNRYKLHSMNISALEGNLCPMLLVFFKNAPDVIYFDIYQVTPEFLALCA